MHAAEPTTREQIAAIWLDCLYEALREAESRADDARLSPLERHAAAMSARHTADQIMRQETCRRRGVPE